jgi:hypothetical protein
VPCLPFDFIKIRPLWADPEFVKREGDKALSYF